jgi:hypothetical protein
VAQAGTAPGHDLGLFLPDLSLLSGSKVHVHLAHCDPPLLPPADRDASDSDSPGKESVRAAAKSLTTTIEGSWNSNRTRTKLSYRAFWSPRTRASTRTDS